MQAGVGRQLVYCFTNYFCLLVYCFTNYNSHLAARLWGTNRHIEHVTAAAFQTVIVRYKAEELLLLGHGNAGVHNVADKDTEDHVGGHGFHHPQHVGGDGQDNGVAGQSRAAFLPRDFGLLLCVELGKGELHGLQEVRGIKRPHVRLARACREPGATQDGDM